MSDKKRFIVEIYETTTEIHEIIVDKEAYDKKDFSIFDYISVDTIIDKEYGDNTDYEIVGEEEVNELAKTTTT